MNLDQIYTQSFCRNLGLISVEEQLDLRNSRVAIPGMGGAGGVHLTTLLRTGIGKFNIADFDKFDYVNFNRQYGAFVDTVGKEKVEVMKKIALNINPSADIKCFSKGINESNIDEFLDDVDVVVDSLDVFVPKVRRMLFNKAREKGIYVVSAGPVGFSSISLVFSPTGMSFDQFFGLKDELTSDEMLVRFLAGLAASGTHFKYMDPKKVDPESGAAPSLGLACQLISGIAASEVVNILLKRKPVKSVPWKFQFDPYSHKYIKRYFFLGARNPLFRLRLAVINRLIKMKSLSKQTQTNEQN